MGEGFALEWGERKACHAGAEKKAEYGAGAVHAQNNH